MGKACQQLQKAGYTPQAILKLLEPIQQNQVIVGAVYASLEKAGASMRIAPQAEAAIFCTSCACSPSQNGLPQN